MVDRLNNREARRLFIARHGLAEPVGSGLRRRDLPTLIESLGFVQIDSIRTVERAHHHILFSRAGTYRPSWLAHHLERERSLFEHWTHDASIVPVEYYAYWKHRFAAARDRILSKSWWLNMAYNPQSISQCCFWFNKYAKPKKRAFRTMKPRPCLVPRMSYLV